MKRMNADGIGCFFGGGSHGLDWVMGGFFQSLFGFLGGFEAKGSHLGIAAPLAERRLAANASERDVRNLLAVILR